MGKIEGTVKWFNRNKGYGFIEGKDGEEYFVHHSALAEGTFIRDNDIVSFDPAETERGKQAQNITLIKKGSEVEAGADEAEAPAEEPAEEEAEEKDEE